MKGERWQTTKQLGMTCYGCGKSGTCTGSPDRQKTKCWPNSGKIFSAPGAVGQSTNGTGYVGAAHRPKQSTGGKYFPIKEAAIKAVVTMVQGGVLADTYTYHNRDRSDAMAVVRIDIPDDKEFRPIHPSKGKWKIGDPPGQLPIFRLPEILADTGAVVITEGEKAALAAVAIGFNATTSAHGSSAPEKTDFTPLAGRIVFIFPDADEPGAKYARIVAKITMQLDPPAVVKIVNLPGLPAAGDIVEYIAARAGQSPDQIRAEIESLINETPELSPEEIIGGPVLVCAADIQPRQVEWLWRDKIPLGRISLIAGRPGCGKSKFTSHVTGRVPTGSPWPDGSPCPRGPVIMANCEDDAADTTIPRLNEAGADLSLVHLLTMVKNVGEDGKTTETTFSLANLPALEIAIKRTMPLAVIIDPLGSYLGGGVDAHRDNEIRAVLAPVARLAEKYNFALIIVCHLRKSGGGTADEMVLGSIASVGIARVVHHLTKDKDNKARRLLLPGKNNLAAEGDGLAFTIGGNPPRLFWEKDPVKMSADDALANESGNGHDGDGEADVLQIATDWLAEELADLQSHVVTELKASAIETGIKWRTLQRAANDLKVIRERAGFGKGSIWRLPQHKPLGTNGGTNGEIPEKNGTSSFAPTFGTNGENGVGTNGKHHSCQDPKNLGTNGVWHECGTNEKTPRNTHKSLSLSPFVPSQKVLGDGDDEYEALERMGMSESGM